MIKLNAIVLCLFSVVGLADTTVTTNYEQTYYRLVIGTGYTCSDAKFNYYQELQYHRANFLRSKEVASEGLVGVTVIPSAIPGGCTQCATIGTGLNTTHTVACVVAGTAKYFSTTVDNGKEKIHTGKKPGKRLDQQPFFIAQGHGLDCFEAKYQAQVALYTQVEAKNTSIQYGNITSSHCACDRTAYPFVAECKVRISASSSDSRASN